MVFHTIQDRTHDTFSQYGVGADKIQTVIEQLEAHGMTALSETGDLTLDVSRTILEKAHKYQT